MANQKVGGKVFSWTISQAASIFKLDRKTVALRIRTFGLAPNGSNSGYPLFDAADLARACFAPPKKELIDDPNLLPPKERKDWYQSETERIRYETLVGEAVKASDVAREMSAIAKIVTSALDSLPDLMERDLGISAADAEKVQVITDRVRVSIFERLSNPDRENEESTDGEGN